MKILQINSCHYRRGGADVVYLNTGALLEKNGHQVLYFSQLSENNLPCVSTTYFIRHTDFFNRPFHQKLQSVFRFLFSLEAKKKITNLIKTEKPEIAHVHLYKGTLTPSILYALKKERIPIVITLHDYGLLCPHNLLLDGKGNICERCINGSSLQCIAYKCNRNSFIFSIISTLEYLFHAIFFPFAEYFMRIVCVSKFAFNLHREVDKLKNKIQHIYNFSPALSSVMPNRKKGNYFLYIGRLSKEKGLETLVQSWRKMKRKTELRIAGTGPLYDPIASTIKKENVNNVKLLGFKQGEELTNLIRNASFVVVPSEWYENNPLTIIEAYSYGKPVIASNIGGIPEIIIDKETGFVFKMKDIDELSGLFHLGENISDSEYEYMSKQARNFADENFSEESHYSQLIRLYEQILLGAKSTS